MYNLIRVRRAYPQLEWNGEPWSDKKMTYLPLADVDETLETTDKDRRYVLTPDAIKNKLAIDINILMGNEAKAKAFLDMISEFIYEYLYDNLDN